MTKSAEALVQIRRGAKGLEAIIPSGHVYPLPDGEAGFRRLARLVRLQDQAYEPEKAKIGSFAAPTEQYLAHEESHGPNYARETCVFCRSGTSLRRFSEDGSEIIETDLSLEDLGL